MHASSMNRMAGFVEHYLDPEKRLQILDVGSMDVCGTYRGLFQKPKWTYTGLDLEAGKNVDAVADHMYMWGLPLNYDVIVSGQCLEHVQDTHRWIKEVSRYLMPEGICCIIAPWQWEEHKFPVDCWRILPDGMRFLLEDVGRLKIVTVMKKENDCIGIAIKSEED